MKISKFPYEWVILSLILLFCAVIGMGIFTHTLTMTLCIIGAVMLIAVGWVCMLYNAVESPSKTKLGFAAASVEDRTIFLNETFDHYENILVDNRKEYIGDMRPARFAFNLDIHPEMHLGTDKVYYYRRSHAITKDKPVFVYLRDMDQHLTCLWAIIYLDSNDRVKSFKSFMDTVEKDIMIKLRNKLESRTGFLDDMGNRKRFRRMLHDEFSRLWDRGKPVSGIMVTSGITRGTFSEFKLFNTDEVEEWCQFHFYRMMSDDEKKRFIGINDGKTGKMK